MKASHSLSSNEKEDEAHFGLKKKSYFVPNIKHSPKMVNRAKKKKPICIYRILKPATKQEKMLENKVLKYLAVCRECSVCRQFYPHPEVANACLKSHRLRRCFACFSIVENEKWDHHFNECHKDPKNPPNCVNCPFCPQLFSYLGEDLEAHVIKMHPGIKMQDAVMSGTVAKVCKQTPHDTNDRKNEGNNVPRCERQLCVIGNRIVKGNNTSMRWDKLSKKTQGELSHPKITVKAVRESNEKRKELKEGEEPSHNSPTVSLSSQETRNEESETSIYESSLGSIEDQLDTDKTNSKDETVSKELCPQHFSSPQVRSLVPKVYEVIDIASEDEQDEQKEQSSSVPEPLLDTHKKYMENILPNSSFDKIATRDQNEEQQQQQANNNGAFYGTDPIVRIPVDSCPSVIDSQITNPVNNQLVCKPQSSAHLQPTPFPMPRQNHQIQSNSFSNVSPSLDERQFRYYNALAYLESRNPCNKSNFQQQQQQQQQKKANCWNANSTTVPPSFQQNFDIPTSILPISSNNYPQIDVSPSVHFPQHSNNPYCPNRTLPMQFTNSSNLHTNVDSLFCAPKSSSKFGQNTFKIPSKSSKCPQCNRRFIHLASLQRHLDTHFGIWPCICKICPRVFLRSKEFIEHALYCHNIVVPPISKNMFNQKVHVLDLQ